MDRAAHEGMNGVVKQKGSRGKRILKDEGRQKLLTFELKIRQGILGV